MVRNDIHAHIVQSRRVAAGKTGIAKAVRRYLQKVRPLSYPVEISRLPVVWPK